MLKNEYPLIALLVSFFLAMPAAAVVKSDHEILVTAIDGHAEAITPGVPSALLLKKGSRIRQNQEIRVSEKSRVELFFPDKTVMRLAANSRLNLSTVVYDSKTESKNMKVGLLTGKIWAKVRKLVTSGSSVEVQTTNAVAGVRGTVYRINVEDDASAVVKVYDGSVYVANPPRDESKPSGAMTAPVPVAGPQPVPPPYHEVSLEEWHVIVMAMQQIRISSQGLASKPESFSAQEDADDWVRWNQERDKQQLD